MHFLAPNFFLGYFVSPKFFLVSISWIEFFFSRGFFVDPIFFYRRYFVGPKFFLVVISWVPNISSSVFRWSQFFFVSISWVKIFFLMADLLIQRFPVASYMKKSDRKQKYTSNYVFFSKSIIAIVNSVYIGKVLHILNYLRYYAAFICTNCICTLSSLPYEELFTRNSDRQSLQSY